MIENELIRTRRRHLSNNPIEAIEDVIFNQEWTSQRLSENEIMAEIAGRWCEYHLHFVWTEENSTLQFFLILMDIEIPPEKRPYVCELVCNINERLPLGHFEIFGKVSTPAFRHGLFLPGTRTVSESLLEQLLDIALESCEKFYPAFQFVIFGNKTPQEAASLSMIDIAGEA